jgi:hypothetical protein
MASAVEICNLALGWLGGTLITQLDAENPSSTEEELCVANYGPALKAVLEAKAWTFATGRVELSPAEATGLEEYPVKFTIPGTVVRVLACDDGAGTFDLKWVREGGFILVERELVTLQAKAVLLEEDAAKFQPGFIRALAARLAADLAIPLTENRTLATEMERKFIWELSRAGALDGAQGSAQAKKTNWLKMARGG